MTKLPSKRRYQVIWEAISAAKVGTVVPVKVHSSAAATLIQAVSKEKSMETSERRKLAMPRAGKLIVARGEVDDRGYIVVNFSLEWDSRRM